jgi:hypothetical protein
MGGAGGADSNGSGGESESIDAGTSAMGGSTGNGRPTPSGEGTCPSDGHVTYTINRKDQPSADEADAYQRIDEILSQATAYYNCYTDITKELSASYEPSVETADGNSNGSVRWGKTRGYMNLATAMHEIGHAVGIGSADFGKLVVDGIFTGPIATAQLREITGIADDQVHGDPNHFWPYGLNYESEYMSEDDLIDHCLMVVAIRKDMGWE